MWQKLKNSWKSFTIWFNGLMLAVVPFIDQAKELVPQLENYIDEHIFKQLMLWLIVGGNVLLRFKTSKDLAEK